MKSCATKHSLPWQICGPLALRCGKYSRWESYHMMLVNGQANLQFNLSVDCGFSNPTWLPMKCKFLWKFEKSFWGQDIMIIICIFGYVSYQFMLRTWSIAPSVRPSFTEAKLFFQRASQQNSKPCGDIRPYVDPSNVL